MIMKVYIVIQEFVRQPKILRVFDSNKKAQEFIDNNLWKELRYIKIFKLE